MTVAQRKQESCLLLGDCLAECENLANTVRPGAVSNYVLDRLRFAGTLLHGNRHGRRRDAVKLLVEAREVAGFDKLRRLILDTILSLTL